ncbi:MAG: hypothetical protein ACFB6R_04950 [Alphaproteobacteria bacterium]
MVLSLLSFLAWPILVGAFIALGWLVRRYVERDRILSENDAYGYQEAMDDLPDINPPLTAFFGLIVLAMLVDMLF